MTTVTKTAIALALTIITVTGALAAPRNQVRAIPAIPFAAVGGGPFIGSPFTATPEEEGRFDQAKGYPSGY